MNTIVDLVHKMCALRRLDLSFELSRDEFPEDYSDKAWKRVLAHWRPTLKALKVSVLLQYVRVIDWSGGYFGETNILEDGSMRNMFARVWHLYPAGTESTTQGMVGLASDCDCSSYYTCLRCGRTRRV